MTQELTQKPRRGRPPRILDERGDTRDALIRAGMEVFTTQGFVITGIDQVLKRVGVPKGSFYHYFASKEDFGRVVLAAYDTYISNKLERWLAAANRPALDRLMDFVSDARSGVIRHKFERGCLVGNFGQEVFSLPGGFREELDRVLLGWERQVTRCLEQGQAAGEIAGDIDCAELGAMFWIGWEGAVMRARLEQSTSALDIFAQAFIKLARR